MKINSVLGPIDTSELGTVLIHEHLSAISTDMRTSFSDWFDEESTLQAFEKAIKPAKSYGLNTYVDASPITLGRDIFLLIKAAERTGLNILCCTGLYWTEDPWFNQIDSEILAQYFIRDLTVGIQGTNRKAAYVKCCTDNLYGKSSANQAMVRAAGMAAAATNVPVYTHDNNSMQGYGLYQQELLMNEGVPAHRICIGHAFTGNKPDYILEIVRRGSYVGCDQVGYEDFCPVDVFAKNIIMLCNMGYSEQIMLSHDKNVTTDFFYSLDRCRRSPSNPITGSYTTVFEKLLPILRAGGVTQDQLDNMLIHNPRRYFEGQTIMARNG